MATKEQIRETEIAEDTPLLEKLKRLPNWETSDFWRKRAREGGDAYMWLNDSSGKLCIEYTASGGEYFNLAENSLGTSTEIKFYDANGELCFQIAEYVLGKGQNRRIKYDVSIAPFTEQYWDGIHYGSHGYMEPLRNVKGLPRKIDVQATVSAFVDQLLAGNFDTQPSLIRP